MYEKYKLFVDKRRGKCVSSMKIEAKYCFYLHRIVPTGRCVSASSDVNQ